MGHGGLEARDPLGATYSFQESLDLVEGSWSNILSLAGFDGIMSASNSINKPSAFYRMGLE